ncbi:nuclease-related domain-containing protein [Isachenkonia alkalipeptolytica]|uniref:NERD domain-containing protein n=1 Tax=Isachenkonia alkalipeptolytica TaxID=2565777 RepID=A0AA43XME4_9CLOT|nr:nuclease-related domain-containing protein [Isachenkonia alkalipeptolytica]NBG88610.1 NERD domain-containing protein [Isachenkonia alkalipeptolytica]
MPIVLIILLLLAGIIFPKLIQYKRSQYKTESGNRFFETILNPKKYGEFLAFTYLEEYQIYRKILTNRFLVKEDQRSVELQLIMISEAGIYVFDVNNYKGILRGHPLQERWSQHYKNKEQTLKNPLLENQKRIQLLRESFSAIDQSRIKSFVLVNNDCTLEVEGYNSEEGRILKMKELINELNEDILETKQVLSNQEVDKLYDRLKKETRRKGSG